MEREKEEKEANKKERDEEDGEKESIKRLFLMDVLECMQINHIHSINTVFVQEAHLD